MGNANITSFQRMRREQAEKLKVKEEKAPKEETNATEGEIESLTLDQVKAKLDELGVKYSHNTGEAKLREKLKGAL